jgi:hypothetical protein
MDGSSVIFIVMPIVIPLVLFAGIALPHIADRRSGGKRSGQCAVFAKEHVKNAFRIDTA